MKIYIAFQTVDSENDIWCNEALLFKSEDDVETFFIDPKKVLKKLEHKLQIESITDIQYKINRVGSVINSITYSCKYAGDVKIVRMSKGHLIKCEDCR